MEQAQRQRGPQANTRGLRRGAKAKVVGVDPRAAPTSLAPSDSPPDQLYDRLIDLHEVRRLTGVGKTTIYELVGQGRFPAPFRLPCRASRWSLAEVRAWIAALPRAGSLGPYDHQANRRELRHG